MPQLSSQLPARTVEPEPVSLSGQASTAGAHYTALGIADAVGSTAASPGRPDPGVRELQMASELASWRQACPRLLVDVLQIAPALS